jgi:hypothetical protein
VNGFETKANEDLSEKFGKFVEIRPQDIPPAPLQRGIYALAIYKSMVKLIVIILISV